MVKVGRAVWLQQVAGTEKEEELAGVAVSVRLFLPLPLLALPDGGERPAWSRRARLCLGLGTSTSGQVAGRDLFASCTWHGAEPAQREGHRFLISCAYCHLTLLHPRAVLTETRGLSDPPKGYAPGFGQF